MSKDATGTADGTSAWRLDRRQVLATGMAAAIMNGAPESATAQSGSADAPMLSGLRTRFVVNGTLHDLVIDPRASLLDVLRERLDLAGTKKGCDHGQCGACTVHLDGRRIVSCLTMAVKAEGRRVTTIEGLASPDGKLHPMQQAFIDHDALQCGYCTPGQIMAPWPVYRRATPVRPNRSEST